MLNHCVARWLSFPVNVYGKCSLEMIVKEKQKYQFPPVTVMSLDHNPVQLQDVLYFGHAVENLV